MANLSVRKLDKVADTQLCIKAATHGISMEEEAHQMIYQTVSAPSQLSAAFNKYFGPENGIDLNALNQHHPQEPIDFMDCGLKLVNSFE